MQMVVDEARRTHHARPVEGLVGVPGGGDLGRFSDRREPAVDHRDRRVADDATAGIDGDQPVDPG